MRIVRLSPNEYTTRGAVYEGHIRPSTANAIDDKWRSPNHRTQPCEILPGRDQNRLEPPAA